MFFICLPHKPDANSYRALIITVLLISYTLELVFILSTLFSSHFFNNQGLLQSAEDHFLFSDIVRRNDLPVALKGSSVKLNCHHDKRWIYHFFSFQVLSSYNSKICTTMTHTGKYNHFSFVVIRKVPIKSGGLLDKELISDMLKWQIYHFFSKLKTRTSQKFGKDCKIKFWQGEGTY